MTAGTEVVCSDVVRKVEIEDKCVGNGGLDNVGGVGNGCVGGEVKDDADEASYVFVSGGVEVSGGDPDDTGGVDGNGDEFGCRSDSADEGDRLKDNGNGVIAVDPLEEVKDGVDLVNGSTVDPPAVVETNAVVQGVNGHFGEAVVESTEEVEDADEVPNVETKTDDIGSTVSDPESSLSTIKSSQVTVTESDSVSHLSDVNNTESQSVVINTTDSNIDCEVMVNNGPESTSNGVDNAECEVTAAGSGKPSEDVECQVTADGSESCLSPTEEQEGQITVDESGKPSEDLASQVTADGSESSVSPTEEQEGQITVDESDLASQVKADGPESCVSPTEEQEGQVTVDESGKPSEDLDCLVTADGSESFVSPTEEREGQATVDESGKSSEDLVSQVTTDEPESSVSPTEEREDQVTVDESGKSCEDLASHVTADEPESSVSPTEEQEGQVTIDESGKPSEDLASQVTAGKPESSVSPTEEQEDQVTVEESGKPSEDLASQVTEDKPESFGSPTKERECEVPVDDQEYSASVESEPNGNHTEEVNGKSEEHQELLVITSDDNIEAEPTYVCDGIKAESLSVSEDMKAEGTDIGLSTESEENLDSELVLSKDTDALANGKAQNFDEILETGETQIFGTEADRSVPLVINGKKEESAEKIEELMEGSSETVSKVADFVEIAVNSEDTKEHAEVEDAVTDTVEDDLKLEHSTSVSINEAEVPLETESNIEPIIYVNTTSQHEVSSSIDEPQEGFQPNGSFEKVETVDLMVSECNNSELLVVKSNESLSTPDELIVVEQKAEVVSDDDEKETEVKDASVEHVSHLVANNVAAEDIDGETEVENGASDYQEKETEVKDAPVESVSHPAIENISDEGMDCETRVEKIDEEKETEVKDVPNGGHSTLSFSDTIVSSGAVIEFGSIGRHETTHNIQNVETEDVGAIQSDEIPTSSVEDSATDSIDVQNEESEVLPYNFLIRIPRYEDESYRDQIRSAQLAVEEKTRLRDAVRAEIQGIRAKLKAHNDAYNAAKTEETAARRLVRLKRQEIDSVQVVINRLKNAMSVEDIDGRIYNMEHMIQHETLLLKDEKQFIREIKQLKSLRDQLASNMGSPEEIKQAIDQKDQNEERMKTLRKELDSLKDKAAKAEAAVKTAGKTYNEESRTERELQARFRDADDVRQNAYAHLNSLKKLSYDKNKTFRQFKDDLTAARDFASHGNKEALYRLCANQVETFMEQWNNNDEFRKDYINRCNMNASRRQRALESTPLVPDDVAPVPPSNVNEKPDNNPVVLPVEQVKIVSSTDKHTDDSIKSNGDTNKRSVEKAPDQKNQNLKTKSVAKSRAVGSDDVAVVAELVVDHRNEVEIELAKKAEELRKEEIAAKLKEQRRLEEKAKAAEALERKKRNAEKAQLRAEMRARKEAEQKEKEREKRLRKKEKKKTDGGDGSTNGEEPMARASLESASEAAVVTKEIETKTEAISKEKNNNKKKAQPPPHFYSKQLKPKPIPPPLVNRNRKRWQQWGKWALAVAAVLVFFLLGNTSYFRIKFNGLI
ncbi:uncharacterized protein LOC143566308 isoform X2 [Bidens hawaiensis]|uniref:uncharacterized protein LOC143566308 isoform X2 n=1 Tax=Bidens hawaiensis TaxID=980011 RepID=UPI004048F8BE